ncbi:MAG: polyphosphate kinase 1 [Pseudomonadales bacterium]|jgi:polyphosphate kinase|nr:polyphosphate kinase 1 [Pseudomonadales bacterium]MDP6470068.1 polyphosphate kinase 1 [Pseudomonadales bacterium]MDP6826971.1 polyphosphate kinase 1 [Pseudomonadales bacterium]MDP6971066.1 polyphosphate kinase 1 [Pseudomonadales bacterium]|tara:strand:- start:258 stop:2336 length:2079 start_codon:yes stop_codon:yes gene_type:complete
MDVELLSNPELYINRELSLLEFHRRVLAQSSDDSLPLLERLRFLCIFSSIVDEFFEIRVAGLKQQEAYGAMRRAADNLSPSETLRRASQVVRDLIDTQYAILNEELLPRLDTQGIRFLAADDWNDKQATWIKRFFNKELAPIMNPVGLDPAHPFPEPLNKSLTFILMLEGKDAFGRNLGKAILQAPRALVRVVRLPDTCATGPYDFVLLSSIIEAHVGELFPGMTVLGCYQFRVTRNSDLFIDEEEVDDLLRALEGELSSRHYGDAVRLEVAQDCPDDLEAFLTAQFQLSRDDVYRCNGPVNLTRLSTVPDLVERPDLKYPGFTPGVPEGIQMANNMFDAIAAGDILLHHPFESFAPFIEFLRQAARDPNVLSIRQTLYRTGPESAVVEALTDAAANGKEVMVVIELRARFDEAANIELANHFRAVGAQVVYGVVGHKAHAKICMVIRREGQSLARYLHLGTGNYHARTTRLYTDYGLFTRDPALGEDVQQVFHQLTAMGKAGRLKKILQSPFTLHRSMMQLIEQETDNARDGKPARVMAKMNSLLEPQVIQALYAASQAGVKVELIVRGICALRPRIKGISENIRVRSIVGRFLEHTRVFYFENEGDPLVYLSSADWMGRNFFNRVETCFPVEEEALKRRVVRESFDSYLADNTHSWQMASDGSYQPSTARGRRRSAQDNLLTELSDLNQA